MLRRLALWLLVAAGVSGLSVALWFGAEASQAMKCQRAAEQALVSMRAAEVCSGSLVGCSLSFEQVQTVMRDQLEAERCK